MSVPQAHFISHRCRPIQNLPTFQSGFQTSSILLSSDTVFPPLWLHKTLFYYCPVVLKQTNQTLFGLFNGYLCTCLIPLTRIQGSLEGWCLLELWFTEGLRLKISTGCKNKCTENLLYHYFLWLSNKWKCGLSLWAYVLEKTTLFQRTESQSRQTCTQKGNEGTGADEALQTDFPTPRGNV